MPAKSTQPAAPAADSNYPAIEGFIEKATAADVEALLQPIKDGLADLKGPRAELAKKVSKAVTRTEELLSHLLQVREKLEASQKAGAKGRK